MTGSPQRLGQQHAQAVHLGRALGLQICGGVTHYAANTALQHKISGLTAAEKAMARAVTLR
jgi:hypothetical protein